MPDEFAAFIGHQVNPRIDASIRLPDHRVVGIAATGDHVYIINHHQVLRYDSRLRNQTVFDMKIDGFDNSDNDYAQRDWFAQRLPAPNQDTVLLHNTSTADRIYVFESGSIAVYFKSGEDTFEGDYFIIEDPSADPASVSSLKLSLFPLTFDGSALNVGTDPQLVGSVSSTLVHVLCLNDGAFSTEERQYYRLYSFDYTGAMQSSDNYFTSPAMNFFDVQAASLYADATRAIVQYRPSSPSSWEYDPAWLVAYNLTNGQVETVVDIRDSKVAVTSSRGYVVNRASQGRARLYSLRWSK